MNINEIITVFRVECRCIYTGGAKTQTIYEDDMIIINNFETASCIRRSVEMLENNKWSYGTSKFKLWKKGGVKPKYLWNFESSKLLLEWIKIFKIQKRKDLYSYENL